MQTENYLLSLRSQELAKIFLQDDAITKYELDVIKRTRQKLTLHQTLICVVFDLVYKLCEREAYLDELVRSGIAFRVL